MTGWTCNWVLRSMSQSLACGIMAAASNTPPAQIPTVPDAAPGNWVDRIAPATWRPYLRLARFDRPIGAWLLLFPCWWGQALAELSLGHAYPSPSYLLLFLAGGFIMRGAGCTYNDLIDKDYDAKVARTAARPIPSGQVSVAEARMFLVVLCLAGFVILIQFNLFTILLGASSLALVAVYPFMKRFTYWPQIMLGLTFKWGALVGWSAVTGSLSAAPIALYAGCVLWTIGYDTIYAHQDKEDDALVGLKSTALRLGDATPRWLAGFYAGAILLWGLAGVLAGARLLFFLSLALSAVQMAWQVSTLVSSDPTNCLARFRSNRLIGWLLLAGLSADMALAAFADAHS
jgi:4-hydroxybenzoate polyprenyltransferase